MDWVEVTLMVDGEAAEAVAEILQHFGHQGVSIERADITPDIWDEDEIPPAEQLIVRAYFPDNASSAEIRIQLEIALRHMNMLYPMPEPVYKLVKEADWANAWKQHYRPLQVGRRLLIRPQWIEIAPDPEQVMISLDPGMAFGTGTHPSTQLCLESLEDMIQPGYHVLDLGCGSGILSIAAAKMGAARVLALDIDPIAAQTTLENAEYNHVSDKITAQTGSLQNIITSARRFDLILVNILAKTIIQMCDHHLGEIVRPGGSGIFSGIIEDQSDAVKTALQKTGFTPLACRRKNDWVLIEAYRGAHA